MNTITTALQGIQEGIKRAVSRTNSVRAVTLVAVSKAQDVPEIRTAFMAGQRVFGENYLQEALQKQESLQDLQMEWHFIGPIQSNKTQAIANHFDWVQTVDRLKIAQRLNDARPENLPPLQVCIQVNVGGEESKSGIALHEVAELAQSITRLPRLRLRGLMTIPRPTENTVELRQQFKAMRACFDALNAQGYALDTLSMGMSDDYEIAIEEGATMVRVGSALFGARPAKSPQT